MSSTYETLRIEVADGVATVRLDRPRRRNAFTLAMLAELHAAFDALERDDDVRAIVVTGTGDYFSVGFDLDGAHDLSGGGAGAGEAETPLARAPWIEPWTMRTPIVAALNGPAVGVGLTLSMTWDIRYAAEDAELGFVFTRRGVIPEWNSLWLLPRLVGVSQSMDLLLSGRLFDGREARERGLVTRALPAAEVLPAAQELARDIAAATSPVAVAITKRAVYRFLQEPDRDAAQDLEIAWLRWVSGRPDAAEGVRAFLEKRAPAWPSRKGDELPPHA